MERKLVGQVSPEERNEIQRLFERKNGLEELAIIVANDDDLYEKVVRDMGKTKMELQAWWNRMSLIYHWESAENGQWEIDFNTCEISLIYK